MSILKKITSRPTDNLIGTASVFLEQINAKVTRSTLQKTLLEHPFYPSMLSVSDALKKWDIDHSVMRIHKENLTKAPTPFLAHLPVNSGTFVVVQRINDGTVEYTHSESETKTITLEQFLSVWQGVALFAEAHSKSGEKHYEKARRAEWMETIDKLSIPLAIAALLTLGWIAHPMATNKPWINLISTLKASGILICLMLIAQDLNLLSTYLQKTCTFNKNTSCKTITQSKAGKLFGRLPWSDLGWMYFAGGLLFSIVAHPTDAIGYLAWLNLCSLPFIIYSLIYQGFSAKKWCTLCLVTLLILTLEAVGFYISYWQSPYNLMPKSFPAFAVSFGLPAFLITYVKPLLSRMPRLEEARYELTRLKRNKNIFLTVLEQQPSVPIPGEDVGIHLGNKENSTTVLKICQPFCGYCAESHTQIEEMLQKKSHLKVKVLFWVNNNTNDEGTRVALHMIGLYKERPPQEFASAMHDWYTSAQKNYNTWAERHPINSTPEEHLHEIDKMLQWCHQAQIEHTPTFFFGNRLLPDTYSIEELIHIVE